jgi:putative peptidoglycan lipid II flippase
MPSQDSMSSPDGPTEKPRKGHAHLVFAGIFLSRIAGIVRQRIMARYFGNGWAADAFTAALKIPNFLQNLLGEGTLSASFIPVYSHLLKEGRDEEAGRVAGAIFGLLLACASAFALIGVIGAPLLVDVVAFGFDGYKRDLAVDCLRIIFPMTSILVLSAWALGIQNSHRQFFTSYVAPVMWNAAMIATLLIYGNSLSLYRLTVALSWGALIGGVLQLLVQVPFVLRLEKSLSIPWRSSLAWKAQMEPVREAVRNAGPAIAGRGVVQLSSYLDVALAGLLMAGAVAAMNAALILYMLPISLFGMSVAASELPDLAREGSGSRDVLRERVNDGLRQIYFFVIPSFMVFMVLGDIVIGGVLQNGRFQRADTLQTYAILAAFSLGLVASTGTRLFSSTFFALRDTKTPARTATVRVVLSGLIGAALMYPFDRLRIPKNDPAAPYLYLGAAGLGIGASIAAWIEWATLRKSLKGKIGIVGAGIPALARMFGAATVSVLVGRGLDYLLPDLGPFVRAMAVLGPTGVTYLAITYAMGLPQARTLVRRATRR